MLTREAILAAPDLLKESLKIPEWGNEIIYVRTMSGTERDSFEQSIIDSKTSGTNLVNVRARLAVRVVCDETGKRIFTDDDADSLGAKSGKALDRIFEVAQRLSGIGNKDVAELQGNS